jgi:hypothetical protein
MMAVRRRVEPVRPERADPGGVGDPQPRQRERRRGGNNLRGPGRELVQVRGRQAEARRRGGEPAQVAGERKRLAAGDLDGLEDPVAHHQAVVEDRDPGLAVGEQLAVHPDWHVPDVIAPPGRAASLASPRRAGRPGQLRVSRVCRLARIGYSF